MVSEADPPFSTSAFPVPVITRSLAPDGVAAAAETAAANTRTTTIELRVCTALLPRQTCFIGCHPSWSLSVRKAPKLAAVERGLLDAYRLLAENSEFATRAIGHGQTCPGSGAANRDKVWPTGQTSPVFRAWREGCREGCGATGSRCSARTQSRPRAQSS